MPRLPTLFLSHGSPLQALADTQATRLWRSLALQLPRPRALLIASAHWEASTPTLSASAAPETLHDFVGFPRELDGLSHPAPGDPQLARRAASLLEASGLPARLDSQRGLDHGAWVPLRHFDPHARLPVIQVSIQTADGVQGALALGAALAPLADEGVLLIGSGHLTHAIGEWFARLRSHGQNLQDEPAEDYVREFGDWVEAALLERGAAGLADWTSAPHARRAHPSPEHFLPLPWAAAAAGPGARPRRLAAGAEGGVLALDAWCFEPSD